MNDHKRKKKNKGLKRKEWAHNRWFKEKDEGAKKEEVGKAVAEEEDGGHPPKADDLGIGKGGSSGSQGIGLAQVLEGQLAAVMADMKTPIFEANPDFGEGDEDYEEDGQKAEAESNKEPASASEIEFFGWAKQVKAEYKVKKEVANKELAAAQGLSRPGANKELA